MSEGCLSVRAMSLELAFCDVDYARGSRAHGRGAPISPPEGSVTGHRSGYGTTQLALNGAVTCSADRSPNEDPVASARAEDGSQHAPVRQFGSRDISVASARLLRSTKSRGWTSSMSHLPNRHGVEADVGHLGETLTAITRHDGHESPRQSGGAHDARYL
jgi:hypothetical protein